ncbi:MAG: response regulator [Eubacteriales bacterium]|nr:response regulator [Eubacteriales bacterium]
MYRLLMVDDEEQIRNGILENCDWKRFGITKVEGAANGVEALQKVRENPPDFLITDLKMPLMDGLSLIREVSAISPDTLCAILSGYDEFTFARQAMKYHVQDYLLKPCSIDSIHELLDSMTRRMAAQKEKSRYLEQMESDYAHLKSVVADVLSPAEAGKKPDGQRYKNELTQRMVELVEEYLGDERLTLNFVAHEILFVNVDYLGKVFSSETGEKFSSFVTRRRIEMAQRLFLERPGIPVNEVAMACGFGYNAQYFSKVFKKMTGYTPSEYRGRFT